MLTLWEKSLELDRNDDESLFQLCINTFHHQYENVAIYQDFVKMSKYDIENITTIQQIPFLPISFFKTHRIISNQIKQNGILTFESSGTTGMETSKHYVADANIYQESFMKTFHLHYGDPKDYIFACLLPSYLERSNSSLVYMCEHLIQASQHPISGFFLHDFERLAHILSNPVKGRKIFLIGVTFGLLDFAEKYELDLKDVIVMETGGMKGRREEQTREEIHNYLKARWNVNSIHSEYGMTELLSQGYSKGDGIFTSPAYLKILVRDPNDPKQVNRVGNGLINVIDLANQYSCSFIATDDVGKITEDGRFEILGRNDHSILRGCSMLAL